MMSNQDSPPSPVLVAKLRQAREAGLGRLAEVTGAEAAKHGLSPGLMQRYLGNFRYYLEPPDRDGLFAFGRLAVPGFDPDEVGARAREVVANITSLHVDLNSPGRGDE